MTIPLAMIQAVETPTLSPWTLLIPDRGRHGFGGFQYIFSGYHGLGCGRRYWQWRLQYFLLGYYRFRIRRRHRFGRFQYIYSSNTFSLDLEIPIPHGQWDGRRYWQGDSNTFSLDTTDTGSGGDHGFGRFQYICLRHYGHGYSGTGGDTFSGDYGATFSFQTLSPWIPGTGETQVQGDSNTFLSGYYGDGSRARAEIPIHLLLDTRTGHGRRYRLGDSNTFSLDTTETGSGGDTGSGDSSTFSLILRRPDQEETRVRGIPHFSLDTTDSVAGGDTGSGDSNTFSLDTTDTGSGGDTGSEIPIHLP